MKNFIILLLSCFVVCISGCASFIGKIESKIDPNNPQYVLYANWQSQKADDFISGKYADKYNSLNCGVSDKSTYLATIERNHQLDIFLNAVDSYYYKNRDALITGLGLNNTFSDILQLVLTGFASFTSGGTPNILAAIATALKGTQLAFNKNVFSDQSPILIATKMDQLRLSKYNDIKKKKTEQCDTYSLDSAMKDAIEYYYAGTVNGALVAFFTETGAQMDKANKDNKVKDSE